MIGIVAVALVFSFQNTVDGINAQIERFEREIDEQFGKDIAECFMGHQYIFPILIKNNCFDELSKSESIELSEYVTEYEELVRDSLWHANARTGSSYVAMISLFYAFAMLAGTGI